MIVDRVRQSQTVSTVPIHLSKQDMIYPEGVIQDFHLNWDLGEFRSELDNWLFIALSADIPDMQDCFFRNRLMKLCYELKALVEATYVIYEAPGMTTEVVLQPKIKAKRDL